MSIVDSQARTTAERESGAGFGSGRLVRPCDGATTGHPCMESAGALLVQLSGFVRALPREIYARGCEAAGGGSIGRHVRHCLDHYSAALGAGGGVCEPGGCPRTIDYDHRERDVPMETDPAAALAAVGALRQALGAVGPADLDTPVIVRIMVDGAGRTADVGSTLGRELAFAAHHALHHHAMMQFIAGVFGVSAPAGFGKAPSTLHHETRAPAGLSA
jgi:hypothetical protein